MAKGLAGLIVLLAGCSARGAIDESKVVDLTYPFNAATVYWPTARAFELARVARGPNAEGKWYASNDFSASEHGGTHLDAPLHFAEGLHSTAQIPLTQLIGPARVIDIRKRCAADRDYLLAPEDIEAHERQHGRIEPGAVVLIYTGWGEYYPDAARNRLDELCGPGDEQFFRVIPDAEQYLGSAKRGTAEGLHFPGIGVEAAHLLVARRVDLVGIDTASLDHGPSTDFKAHRILNGANIPGLENVAKLRCLPPRGAVVIALPMKIDDGTGGPCRIIALLP